MLSIFDPLRPAAISRRELLRVGAFGTIGLSLPQLLRAEDTAAPRSPKSCILIFADGGPSQLDTFDPKPDAPAEIRGEFEAIGTSVPGIQVCEHLPRLAKLADEFALIRSVSHNIGGHMAATYLALTGHHPPREQHPVPPTPEDVPAIGSTLARFRPSDASLPSYVVEPQLSYDVGIPMPGQFAGMLGDRYAPFVVNDDPSRADFQVSGLALQKEMTMDRLSDRLRLLKGVEARLGYLGQSLDAQRLDDYNELAYNLLSSPAAKRAFDLAREPDVVRDRYGRNRYGQSYLMARRLIESGVRMVLVNDIVNTNNDRWDNHGGTFGPMRKSLPETDAALSALLEDLRDRRMLDDTLVVWMGEMGRGPKAPHGDHWPQCYTVLMSGGGVRGGQTYGASDKHAAYPAENACTPGDVVATIYHAMGIPSDTTVVDLKGRPIYLYNGEPIRAIF